MRSFVRQALLAILLPLWLSAGQSGKTASPNHTIETQPITAPAVENQSPDSLPSAYATAEGDSAAVIGVDDVVTIAALNSDEISKAWRVAASGDLILPILGRVRAAGLTEAQLEQELSIRLKEFVRNPQVTVFISEFHGHPATVSGAVEKPGVVQLKGPTTLFEALVLAGGPKEAGPTVTLTRAREYGTIPHANAKTSLDGMYSVL